jgi:hypothetical protein
MPVTIAWQVDWVQLEQSDIYIALNMVKMAKVGNSFTAMEETQFLIKKHHAEV